MIYLQKKNYPFGISTCKNKENTLKFDITENQQIIVDKIIERYQNRNESASESDKAYTNGISETDCKILGKIFEDLIPGQSIGHAMVLVEHKPWVIHTDYLNNNDKNPANAILIPNQDIETSTLIFNEECTAENFDDFPTVKNHVSEEIYEQYLSHCDWHKVQKVSVNEIYKWRRGTGVVWDRKALHSSDNFLKNGVTTKIALTIFTKHVAD